MENVRFSHRNPNIWTKSCTLPSIHNVMEHTVMVHAGSNRGIWENGKPGEGGRNNIQSFFYRTCDIPVQLCGIFNCSCAPSFQSLFTALVCLPRNTFSGAPVTTHLLFGELSGKLNIRKLSIEILRIRSEYTISDIHPLRCPSNVIVNMVITFQYEKFVWHFMLHIKIDL